MLKYVLFLLLIIIAERFRANCLSSFCKKEHLMTEIRRDNIIEDTLKLYSDSTTSHFKSLYVKFVGEQAIDDGGVTRDFYSAFWEAAYMKYFDGSNLLLPAVHPGAQFSCYSTLGAIVVHGYLISGVLPVKIPLPVLCKCLVHPGAVIPVDTLMKSFADILNPYEAGILHSCLNFQLQHPTATEYPSDLHWRILGIMSNYGCRTIPKPANLKTLIFEVATTEYCVKPMAAIYNIYNGIPEHLKAVFSSMQIEDFLSVYEALTVSASKVLDAILEPVFHDSAEERIFGYLVQLIGNMSHFELSAFLRFVTGSSVACKSIKITFCSTGEFARRPVGHTCDSTLDLPISYTSYLEFSNEFRAVLSSEYAWIMDCIQLN